MKLGLQLANLTLPGGPPVLGRTIAQAAANAEKAGFHSVWVMDHFFQIPFLGPAELEMLEGYSTLAFLAAHTERVKLGTMVTGVTYRAPAILVKTATTLDVLSGGRAYFGVGAAWFEREHQGLGVHYPPVSERFERLEETLQIALQMWSGKVAPYHGKHYKLAETLCVPMPLSKPHPPILIGGGGEKKTLRLVAKYAQACNLFMFEGIDKLKGKLDILREHCDREGTRYDAIEKTVLGVINVTRNGGPDAQTPTQVVEMLHGLAEIGINHAIFGMPNVTDPGAWDLLGSDVVPLAARM